MAGERSEQASPRRKQKAREEGDRPRSRELVAADATLAGTWALGWPTPGGLAGWRSAFAGLLGLGASSVWRGEDGVAAILELRAVSVYVMLPLTAVLGACAGAALLSGVVQGGGVTFYLPRWRGNGLGSIPCQSENLVSLRAATRLGKTLVPVALLAILACTS